MCTLGSWLTRSDDSQQLWESLLLSCVQNSDQNLNLMNMEHDNRDDNEEFDKAGKEILLKLGSGLKYFSNVSRK